MSNLKGAGPVPVRGVGVDRGVRTGVISVSRGWVKADEASVIRALMQLAIDEDRRCRSRMRA